MNNETKPLVQPLTDLEWLRRKIEKWERAEVQAEIRLAEARNQLAYYRAWLADVEEANDSE